MSGDSSYYSRRHSDRYYRDDRYHRDDRHHRDDSRHYDYRRTRDRDSRDSYRSDNHQRRVPGLVSDPDSHLGDVDKAIQRGQRETVSRVQSGRANYYKPTKEASSTVEYRSPISTVTQPYYRSAYKNADSKKSQKYFYNPSFLSFLPGLAGFALIISAVVLPSWLVEIIIDIRTSPARNQAKINYIGLFTVCEVSFTADTGRVEEGCSTLEEFTNSGSSISSLEQATRGLIIITAIIAFVAVVVAFVLGLRRLERQRGAYIIGGLYIFAGVCGVAGMGCFSAVLTNSNTNSGINQESLAGTSFYLGWFGVGLLFIAAVIAFAGHFAKKRK